MYISFPDGYLYIHSPNYKNLRKSIVRHLSLVIVCFAILFSPTFMAGSLLSDKE